MLQSQIQYQCLQNSAQQPIQRQMLPPRAPLAKRPILTQNRTNSASFCTYRSTPITHRLAASKERGRDTLAGLLSAENSAKFGTTKACRSALIDSQSLTIEATTLGTSCLTGTCKNGMARAFRRLSTRFASGLVCVCLLTAFLWLQQLYFCFYACLNSLPISGHAQGACNSILGLFLISISDFHF